MFDWLRVVAVGVAVASAGVGLLRLGRNRRAKRVGWVLLVADLGYLLLIAFLVVMYTIVLKSN
ncbi:MAG: hypothetical protein ACR2OO_08960 [Thermomicrobiales bacterium]